jgi:hypothetical protein
MNQESSPLPLPPPSQVTSSTVKEKSLERNTQVVATTVLNAGRMELLQGLESFQTFEYSAIHLFLTSSLCCSRIVANILGFTFRNTPDV